MKFVLKTIIFIFLFIPFCLYGQQYGNAGYANSNSGNNKPLIKTVQAPIQSYSSTSVTLEVSGIYNLEADGYVAIFAATQTGKDAEETDRLMNEQVNKVKKELASMTGTKVYVDLVSFVPLYEYDVTKKLFSKKTYKETPKGFELKKNIHVQYKDANLLDKIISACAKAEIYDLVKVDYYTEKLEQFKDEMRQKALAMMRKKKQFNKDVLGIDLDTKKRTMGEGFLMMYPIEQYDSYQAYSSNSLTLPTNNTGKSRVTTAEKSTTYYYNPIMPKTHDFVMNSDKLEPSMQLIYRLSVTYDLRDEKEQTKPQTVASDKPKKEYILITSDGQIKPLVLD